MLKSCCRILVLFTFIFFISCTGQTNNHTPSVKGEASQPIPVSSQLGKLSQDSLDKRIIKCGIVDKSGNIWFTTTWTGLIRYDGKNFTRYTTNDGLCSNFINTIYEDKDGILWIGTDKGICSFDGKSFTTLSLPEWNSTSEYSARKESSKYVVSIIQDKKENMWFGIWGDKGPGAYRYDGKNFKAFSSDRSVSGIVEDNDGGIWLNDQRFDGTNFTDYSTFPNVFPTLVFNSFKDKSGDLWFGVRSKGLYRFNGKTFIYYSEKDGLRTDRVATISQDKTGKLWFGSDIKPYSQLGRLFSYDGKKFTEYPMIQNLGVYSVWFGMEDNHGNMWFGGRGGKLVRYDGKLFTDFSE